jgi:hypothetical protein
VSFAVGPLVMAGIPACLLLLCSLGKTSTSKFTVIHSSVPYLTFTAFWPVIHTGPSANFEPRLQRAGIGALSPLASPGVSSCLQTGVREEWSHTQYMHKHTICK